MQKVSIIVPVYNVEQYLHECLDSVINQTLRDIEIICINDGSTDQSLKILREYEQKDDRIKVISKPNSGYGHTMNVGLDNATGEYIGIVESDDYVALDMYETLYKYAKKHNVDLIKADFYSFTVKQDKPKLVYRDLSLGRNHYYHKVLDPSKNLDVFRFIINTWTGIYNKTFIDKYNIRHNETPGASYQDIGFNFQVLSWASRVFFLDRPLYRHRWDNPQSSINSKGKVFCGREEYHFIRQFLNSNPNLKSNLIYIYSVKRYLNYMYTYRRIAENYKRMLLKQLSTDFIKAKNDGELDEQLFTKTEWNTLNKIINDPEAYYFENRAITNSEKWRKELRQTRRELKAIQNSYSYKIGKVIIFFPRLCCKVIAKLLKTNKLTVPLYKFLRFTKYHGLMAALQKAKCKALKVKIREYNYYKNLGPERYPHELKIWFYIKTGEKLNLKRPQTFNEKIQWLKLYDSTPLKRRLADKFLVREWIREKIGDQYLIPLLGIWDRFDDIDFNTLPEQFVLKANHGCGWNIIVKDKSLFDITAAKLKFDQWMNTNFAFITGFELHYKDISPKIIAEKYIQNDDSLDDGLMEYKFMCFNGKVEYIRVQSERDTALRIDIVDTNWNLQLFTMISPNSDKFHPEPKYFREMLGLVEILCKDFVFVRVDLYETENRIYFSEMTFTTGSGIGKFEPPEYNLKLGKMLTLPEKQNSKFFRVKVN